MSAAIIVDTFPRWSERFIARELNELKRRGVAFSIYCLKAGDAECERDPEFADLIQHRVVLPACFLPSFARNLGADAAAKARLSIVESTLGVTGFRQIGCADSLAKLIRENLQRIVYAHFASLPSTLGWLAAMALKLPFVMSCHARDVFVEPQLLELKVGAARRVFTCNKKAGVHLLERFGETGERKKIVWMRHGLPLERYDYSRRRSAGTEPFRLLAAGRFVPKKGFDDLLEALTCPELEHQRLTLTILGDGPERKALQRQIVQEKLTGRVSLPGVLLGPEMQAAFDAADAFVMPSVEMNDGDSDGLPNVVLEAFALGLPVIGTTSGSLDDVLNESTGFVAGPAVSDSEEQPTGALALGYTRPRDLARTIREAIDNPSAARARAANARASVEERYDIRKNIEPLIQALSESH